MADFTKKFEYVDFWPRVAVALLDSLIFYYPLTLVTWGVDTFDLSVRWLTPLPFFLDSLVFSVLPPLFFVVRWGGTPGKLILKMRIVDHQGRYLGIGRAIRREALNYSFMVMLWVQLYLFIRQMDRKLVSAPSAEISQAYYHYWGNWGFGLVLLILLILIIDILVVAIDLRNRALHDFIAGSYVITKRSYDAIHTSSAPATPHAPGDGLPESGPA